MPVLNCFENSAVRFRPIADIESSRLNNSMRLIIIFTLTGLVAGLISFFVSRFSSRLAGRLAILMSLISAPLLAYTGWYAWTAKAGDDWTWWMPGIVMLSPVLVAWAIGTFFGWAIARTGKAGQK